MSSECKETTPKRKQTFRYTRYILNCITDGRIDNTLWWSSILFNAIFLLSHEQLTLEYVLSCHQNSLSTGDGNSRALMGCFIAIINFNLKFHFQLISLFTEKKEAKQQYFCRRTKYQERIALTGTTHHIFAAVPSQDFVFQIHISRFILCSMISGERWLFVLLILVEF